MRLFSYQKMCHRTVILPFCLYNTQVLIHASLYRYSTAESTKINDILPESRACSLNLMQWDKKRPCYVKQNRFTIVLTSLAAFKKQTPSMTEAKLITQKDMKSQVISSNQIITGNWINLTRSLNCKWLFIIIITDWLFIWQCAVQI